MAKEFLLVDGYNIIHAWSELRELVEDVSLESARQRLMDILSNYKGTKQATVILVFDGYLVKGCFPNKKILRNSPCLPACKQKNIATRLRDTT